VANLEKKLIRSGKKGKNEFTKRAGQESREKETGAGGSRKPKEKAQKTERGGEDLKGGNKELAKKLRRNPKEIRPHNQRP